MAKLDTVRSILRKTQQSSLEHHTYRYGYNPLVESGQDPWLLKYRYKYYYCTVNASDSGIEIRVTSSIYTLGEATLIGKWAPYNYLYARDIWAPELHNIAGKWFIYFAADDGNNARHRMYVLEASAPAGPWRLRGKVAPPHPRWAIDGTVLWIKKRLYFVWSGWHSRHNTRQCIFIASMRNPWAIDSNAVWISHPQYGWEGVINEGPEALEHKGQIFIIYSANKSYTDKYCLGQLAYRGGNPMNPYAWRKKPYPIFHSHGQIFGPGHASFTSSIHNHRRWLIYHAEKFSRAGWNREVRAKPITWNKDCSPHLGIPR